MKKILVAVCIAGCAMTSQAAGILGNSITGALNLPKSSTIPAIAVPLGTHTITASGNTFSNSSAFNVLVNPTSIIFNISKASSFNAGVFITLKDNAGDFPGIYTLTSSSASGISAGSISTIGNLFKLNLAGTSYGTGGQAIFTLVPPVSAVPEPETLAMLLAGLGLVGSIAGRRRRAVGRPVVQPA